MDVLYTIGYAIASYIVIYAILMLIGAVLSIWFFLYVFRQWKYFLHQRKKKQREFDEMAAEHRACSEEFHQRFQERRKRMER